MPHHVERAWAAASACAKVSHAAAAPSLDLEQRVLDAARRAHLDTALAGRQQRGWAPGTWMAAAALVLIAAGVAAGLAGRRTPSERGAMPLPVQASEPREMPPVAASLPLGVGDLDAPARVLADANAAPDRPIPATELFPVQETVQLVRIRMPVTALAALGITTTDPDTSGIVDVDVTVGDDGLARDIRAIHRVPSTGRE